jgi:hypothetical protein
MSGIVDGSGSVTALERQVQLAPDKSHTLKLKRRCMWGMGQQKTTRAMLQLKHSFVKRLRLRFIVWNSWSREMEQVDRINHAPNFGMTTKQTGAPAVGVAAAAPSVGGCARRPVGTHPVTPTSSWWVLVIMLPCLALHGRGLGGVSGQLRSAGSATVGKAMYRGLLKRRYVHTGVKISRSGRPICFPRLDTLVYSLGEEAGAVCLNNSSEEGTTGSAVG